MEYPWMHSTVRLEIPLDESPNPLRKFGARLVTHVARQVVNIRRRIRHVVQLHGHEFLDRLAPQALPCVGLTCCIAMFAISYIS